MKTLTDSTGKSYLMSIPITLDCTKEQMEALKMEKQIALTCSSISASSEVYAIIENPVFFENRKKEIAARVLGTLSKKNSKVMKILN
jgi:ATP sulfurylase